MSLKKMLEEQKISENEQESCSDLELIEQQSQRIEELREQLQWETDRADQAEKQLETVNQTIQTLSSNNSKLKSELRQKSETIKSLNEQIAKLHESDLVLKENEKLKQKNEQLQKEANLANEKVQACEARCEERIQAVKDEYDEKVEKLDKTQKAAYRAKKDTETLKSREDELIRKEAKKIYAGEEKRLKSSYKTKLAAHKTIYAAGWIYGLLATVLTAAQSKQFMSDFTSFLGWIGTFVYMIAQVILELAAYAAQLGDMIPQDTVAIIVHWIIMIAILAAAAVGAGVLLVMAVVKFVYPLIKNFIDLITLAEVLVSLAVIVWFAKPIRSILQLNLILLMIIIFGLFIFVRMMYDSGSERDWRY